ncbi:MAG: response regulator, partial [Defluviitaleaceae bacterium]|nr:response regulator [Defluviitaleaceae bacterium]
NNLLSNAFKYTCEGFVKLAFDVDTDPESGGFVLVITISDSGQGMPLEQIDNLFNIEYTRLNTKNNRAIEGSGLGMAIAYQLVQMMGGEINVQSALGVGSTFTVRIPQTPDGTEVLGKQVADTLQSLDIVQKSVRRMSKLIRKAMPYGRVLVVDDVESNLYVAKGLMLPYKLAIETVESGSAAIAKVKNGNVYDIIFMDHMMPEMDGIEAVKIIRECGYDHPIVALTANTVIGQAEIFIQQGFSGFISKPIDPNLLDKYLHMFIRDNRTPEELAAAESLISETEGITDISVRLIESFLRDAKRAIDILGPIAEKHLLDCDDIKTYTVHVHGMKSALANVGEFALADIAGMLEKAGRKMDISTIRAETPYFLGRLAETVEALTPICDDEQDTTDEDIGFLRDQLQIIQAACESYDNQLAKKTLEALGKTSCSKKTKDLLSEISTHLLHGDFEDAAESAAHGAKTI